ncbi:16S rRNA (uracil(1498)-N(3))-methyltransferase [bacterium]|nr:16S rRNA (uracil(1498)-N(3))-methyltransferase [bacterium]
MPIFIVKNNPQLVSPIHLTKEDEHHLRRVMRAKVGDEIFITNNGGVKATARLTKLNPLKIEITEKSIQPPPIPLTVCLPLIEQKRLEWAIEKLTEMNIAAVQLMTTQRTQTRNLTQAKLDRLFKISETAQKQSLRVQALHIYTSKEFNALIGQTENIFFGKIDSSQENQKQKPRFLIKTPSSLFIGPEGGFTKEEQEQLEIKAAQALSMGTTVLKTETACLVLASCLLSCCYY